MVSTYEVNPRDTRNTWWGMPGRSGMASSRVQRQMSSGLTPRPRPGLLGVNVEACTCTGLHPETPIANPPVASSPQTFRGNQLDNQPGLVSRRRTPRLRRERTAASPPADPRPRGISTFHTPVRVTSRRGDPLLLVALLPSAGRSTPQVARPTERPAHDRRRVQDVSDPRVHGSPKKPPTG